MTLPIKSRRFWIPVITLSAILAFWAGYGTHRRPAAAQVKAAELPPSDASLAEDGTSADEKATASTEASPTVATARRPSPFLEPDERPRSTVGASSASVAAPPRTVRADIEPASLATTARREVDLDEYVERLRRLYQESTEGLQESQPSAPNR